ncbi:MAG: helicase-related protein [Dehalococcoidia bacterium]
MKKLERTFSAKERGHYPIDVLLASNMLSVGVDIDRLGLMVVTAQPKTSAEYIQATSRVGRVFPGLVVESYNWARPRDTSHYERFRHYHDTFYRHVEATSVTPFSARARDRALPGVLVSYLRLDDPTLSPEQSANVFDATKGDVPRVIGEIVSRAYDVTGRDDVRVETEQQLKNLTSEWMQWTSPPAVQPLVYTGRGLKPKDPPKTALLRPMEYRGDRGLWKVAGSLREVEGEIPVVLLDPTEDLQ